MAVSTTVDGVTVESSSGTADDLAASLSLPSAATPKPPSSVPSPPPPTTPEQPAAPPTPPPPADDDDAEPDPASEAGKTLRQRRRDLQTRLDRANWEKHEERRRAERLEQELAAIRQAQTASKTPAPDGRPKLKDFVAQIGATYEDYESAVEAHTDALSDWKLSAREKASLAAQQQRGFADTVHTSNLRGRESHADFDATMSRFVERGRQFTPFMADAILSDPEKGHELAYLLATDDAAYDALAQVTTLPQASRLLGSLYARVDGAPPGSPAHAAPVSKAKPPVKPVVGQPAATGGPPGDDASDEEHRLYYDQQARSRRRRA